MVETSAVARSPIAPEPPERVVAGWAVSARRSAAALTLTDETPLAKVAVKASETGTMADLLDVPFGGTGRQAWMLEEDTRGVEVLLTGSAPGEWLALAPPMEQAPLLDRLEQMATRADELVTVVDITHGRALIRLAGARSPDLLAKECGIDLSEAMFPDRRAKRAAVAGVATDLVRDDQDGTRSYLLHCERSSGQYLFDSLLDAGLDLGAEVNGFEPPGT